MFSTGTEVFVALAQELPKRALHPARILSAEGSGLVLQLIGGNLPTKPGTQIVIFFDHNHQFEKQMAEIVPMEDPSDANPSGGNSSIPAAQASSPGGVTFSCNLVGEPLSAEARQSYRVCTIVADITGDLGAEKRCQLIDISMTGFAMAAKSLYKVGDTVAAVLRHEGTDFKGRAVIQSVRRLPSGLYRYGLQCIEERGEGNTLIKGCKQMSMAWQRAQLKRLAEKE